jgi:hypothetical protein
VDLALDLPNLAQEILHQIMPLILLLYQASLKDLLVLLNAS